MTASDPVALTAELIRHASVTPHSAGALDVVSDFLRQAGFTCTRLPFSEAGTPDVDTTVTISAPRERFSPARSPRVTSMVPDTAAATVVVMSASDS